MQEIQQAYDLPGPANPTSKPLKQVAAEIVAYFKALNYVVRIISFLFEIDLKQAISRWT